MLYVFFHVLFQFVDAPKAPDLQPLGRSPAGPPGAAGASRAPAAAPMFCPTLAILQSCNLESISQGLVLFCIDAKFCK